MKKFWLLFFFLFSQFAYVQAEPISISSEIAQNEMPKEFSDEIIESIPSPQYQKSFVRMMVLVLVFIVLVTAAYVFLKKMIKGKYRPSGPSQSIKILEKKVLSPKTMLFLIEVEKEKVLISESQVHVKHLHKCEKIPVQTTK